MKHLILSCLAVILSAAIGYGTAAYLNRRLPPKHISENDTTWTLGQHYDLEQVGDFTAHRMIFFQNAQGYSFQSKEIEARKRYSKEELIDFEQEIRLRPKPFYVDCLEPLVVDSMPKTPKVKEAIKNELKPFFTHFEDAWFYVLEGMKKNAIEKMTQLKLYGAHNKKEIDHQFDLMLERSTQKWTQSDSFIGTRPLQNTEAGRQLQSAWYRSSDREVLCWCWEYEMARVEKFLEVPALNLYKNACISFDTLYDYPRRAAMLSSW